MKCATASIPGVCLLAILPAVAAGQTPERLMPIEFENSAEFAWLQKPVLDRRVLDDMSDPDPWRLQGTGDLSFPEDTGPWGMRFLRVDMQMFHEAPAPTSNGLSSVNLRRLVPGEDWSAYNRISMWIRPEISGFPMLPLQIVLHNQGEVKVPDAYYRDGIHYVTLLDGDWQHVVWEIEPLARDSVTMLEIGYWVNKRLADPSDRVAFEIGAIELQRVEPDHYEGWSVAPGRIAFSHTGYEVGSAKTALASDLAAREFSLLRIDDTALGEVAFTGPVETLTTRLGTFQRLDFSEVRRPGRYVVHAGDVRTRPFRIDEDVWRGTVLKALNFLFGNRCGYAVPGSHGVNHLDWMATHGDDRIVMNGGWHDAGDLSQGMVNTGEATYTLFALAERLQTHGNDPELLERVIDEAKWGLDWVLRVRFPGGYRIGFAGNNLWTNGIIGDEDDRSREALNNPNVNYIAASAGAIAYRVLKDREPGLAARSLRIAEDDWSHAIDGVPGPTTWSTPAFKASAMELAGIGSLASLELYRATGRQRYADKAIELARTIVASQQKSYVGSEFPLAGFFYRGPARDTLFHQFHRGNDQAPIVALSKLSEAFPDHPEWMDWYATVARYAEYQKTAARTTAPYGVLPAYVYRDSDHFQVAEDARHEANPDGFLEQVLEGMPMGDGYYLRAFPVWFSRRGNYGVLLAQAKALSTAAHLRGDRAAAELAQNQAQWIVGRNPFVQSTMYGEGYDWAQQYSVSSGDLVGALPVGMTSRGATDLPYWPSQNMYVYKEVWTHSTSRWLWLMEDLTGPALIAGRVVAAAAHPVEITEATTGRTRSVEPDAGGAFRTFVPNGDYTIRSGDRRVGLTALPGGSYGVDLRPGRSLDFTLESETTANGEVTIRLTAFGDGEHRFALRTDNLAVDGRERRITLHPDRPGTVEWTGTMGTTDAPWVAVVVRDGDVTQRRDAVGSVPRFVLTRR